MNFLLKQRVNYYYYYHYYYYYYHYYYYIIIIIIITFIIFLFRMSMQVNVWHSTHIIIPSYGAISNILSPGSN